jgi:glycosyltransferase involved in cell wall biosynthesis
MDKKRILFVLIQLDAGGAERVALDLAGSLDPMVFDVYVAAFKNGILEKDFRSVCKEVFFIEKKAGFDFSAMLKLSKIVARNRIDVVNAHHYMSCFYSFFGACIVHRRKLIYTEHSVPEVVCVASGRHGKMLDWMLCRMAAVIGVSREITDEFRKFYSRHSDKISMVLNGVDVEKFKCRDRREDVRRQFGFLPEHFVVGMVANFRKVKNHACLIRAVVKLKNECPQLRVLLVGTGFVGDAECSEVAVRKMIADYEVGERVVLAGYRGDVPAVLSSFDAFCLPSFSEGLPVSVLEAMASGLVVVASDVSGISEVIEHGETGLLFPSNDERALAKTLKGLVTNGYNCSAISDNVKESVNDKYCKSRWVKIMSEIFTRE